MGQNRRYGLPSERAHGRQDATAAEAYRPVVPTSRHVWARLERSRSAAEHAGIVLGWRQRTSAPAADESGWFAQVAYVDLDGLHLAWLPAEQLRPGP